MGEALKAAQGFYDAFATAEVANWIGLFSADCLTVTPAGAFDKAGHEALGRAFHDAFPDAHMEVARTLESGDEVYISGRLKGTHTGDLISPNGTIPASGRSIDFAYVDYFRVIDGKIVARFRRPDRPPGPRCRAGSGQGSPGQLPLKSRCVEEGVDGLLVGRWWVGTNLPSTISWPV